MNRDCFVKLVSEIKPYRVHHIKGGPKISVENALYMTLWWLGNEDCLREISDRFGISIGRTHAINLQICKIITKLSEKYIRCPNEREMLQIATKFESMRQRNPFPNVVGCLDSTHVKIKSPSTDSSSYFNRKGYHSMILQGICDNNFVFRNVFFGWPGSSHDAAVWNSSKIGKSLADKTIKLIEGGHLLGDSAYSFQTYLITPYRDNGYLSQNQKKFNYLHSSIKVCVEQAFGILKSKFRILNYVRMNKISNIKYIVLACIVLHNFLRINTNTEIAIVLNIENLNEEKEYLNENEQNNEDMENAITKKDVLLTNL